MGYTHYFRMPKVLNKKIFKAFTNDCKKIVQFAEDELGIKVSGPMGEGDPEFEDDGVFINGSSMQPKGVWTTPEQISIPWPAENASIEEPSSDPIDEKTDGTWFAGHLLSQRCAPLYEDPAKSNFADGSYESFCIPRVYEPQDWEDPNEKLIFHFCKTAYRPYDLVVTAMLIALKHHFPKVKISSDGNTQNWMDGMLTCDKLFGYGLTFELS